MMLISWIRTGNSALAAIWSFENLKPQQWMLKLIFSKRFATMCMGWHSGRSTRYRRWIDSESITTISCVEWQMNRRGTAPLPCSWDLVCVGSTSSDAAAATAWGADSRRAATRWFSKSCTAMPTGRQHCAEVVSRFTVQYSFRIRSWPSFHGSRFMFQDSPYDSQCCTFNVWN